MRIAHSADNHIGYRRYSSVSLQEDYKTAALELVDQTIAHKADVLVLSGDLLHASRTSAPNPYVLREIHDKAKEAGLPVLSISGNHDQGEISWAKVVSPRILKDGDHVDDGGLYCIAGMTVTVAGKSGKKCRIHGCKVAGKDALKEYDFTPCDVFLYHGPVWEFFSFGDADSIPAIEDFPWDSIASIAALGDIHKREIKTGPGGKLIGYPGSTLSTQKSEDTEKSFFIYDLEKGTTETVPVVIDRKTIKMAVSSEEELEALKSMVEPGKKYLIHLTYPGEQYHLLQRIRQLFELDKVFIDPNPVYKSSTASAAARASVDGDVEEDEEEALRRASALTIEDIVKLMTGGKGVLYNLVSGLVSPDVDSITHIDDWVENRMKDLGLEITPDEEEGAKPEAPVPPAPPAG